AADHRADARGPASVKNRRVRRLFAVASIGAGLTAAFVLLRRRIGQLRRPAGAGPPRPLSTVGGPVVAASTASLRVRRRLDRLRPVARGGARYASSAPRLFVAAGEHRQRLRNDLALQTAEDVATTLGAMKGVLMKLGQMASYVDDGLSPAVRRTLSRLQDSVPPMSPELAAQVITEELGQPPERAFATW